MRRLATPLFAVLLTICLSGTNAKAGVIFFDNFTLDLVSGGGNGAGDIATLTSNPQVTWTVFQSANFPGDIDLIGGSFFGGTICTSNNVGGSTGAGGTDPCIDLAGSSLFGGANNAGALLKSNGFTLTGGTQYDFSFTIAGSQRGNDNAVMAGFMDASNNFLGSPYSATLHTADPFTLVNVFFTPPSTGTYYVGFEDSPGNPLAVCAGNLSCGYMGALVDNAALQTVPEPATAAFLTIGIAGLALYRARRKSAAK